MTEAVQSQDDGTAPVQADNSSWKGEEFKALALAVGALLLWIGAIALFGVAGVIIPALALVGAGNCSLNDS